MASASEGKPKDIPKDASKGAEQAAEGGRPTSAPSAAPIHFYDDPNVRERAASLSHTSPNSSDIFSSPMDAAEINLAMFSMPTSCKAKRMAILDVKEEGATTPAKRVKNCESDAEDETSAPHPLNATLDHLESAEEMGKRQGRVTDQMRRLSRFVAPETAPRAVAQRDSQPLFICMVGLPARGKTYTSRRIMRYLAWLGVRCQVFNVAIYRRKIVGFPTADFFSFADGEQPQLLDVFQRALKDAASWLRSGAGQVAILDGTNHTRERRAMVTRELAGFLPQERIMYIEMNDVCGGARASVSPDTVLSMPEYNGRDPGAAFRDFSKRMEHYEKSYEPIEREENIPHIKFGSTKMAVRNMDGYLAGRLAFLLMNLKVMNRRIFLCLTGEDQSVPVPKPASQAMSAPNSPVADPETRTPPVTCSHKAGSRQRLFKASPGEGRNALVDSAALRDALTGMLESEEKVKEREALEPDGDRFARSLVDLLKRTVPDGAPVTVWSCHDAQGHATVKYLKEMGYQTVFWRYLGEFGFSVAQKLMGETYEDIIERLEPIIFEIERCETDLLICGHSRVMNAVYGYLSEKGLGVIQPRTVVRLEPRAYDLECATYELHPTLPELHQVSSCAPVRETREPNEEAEAQGSQ